MMACVMTSHNAMAQADNKDRETFGDDFRKKFQEFRNQARNDYESFRQKCIDDYSNFVRQAWQRFDAQEPVPQPVIDETPPEVMPDRDKPIEIRKIPIEVIVPQPKPIPQPKPVFPIIQQPKPQPTTPRVDFRFYGTECSIPFDAGIVPQALQVSEDAVADAIDRIGKYQEFENTLATCLKLREEMQLSDWAYLQMLEAFATQCCGSYDNSAVVLQGMMYSMSGYKMRFGADDSRLYLFYASRHQIYNIAFYSIDGDRYYPYKVMPTKGANITRAAMPKEQSLSLYIKGAQQFEFEPANARVISSRDYKGFSLPIVVSKNDIDFYNTYPSSEVGGNFMTRWAMYANTPMQADVRLQIRTSLQPKLAGLSKKEAAERLLNLVQTGLEYEYDEKVWGHDRAFFAEESLFYPYCDCEDRSILFTRLVRDLLGLKCILIYYPGHLASAVRFDEPVNGDYILLDDEKYIVCDPTYIGAPVGDTMPKMDNQSAKVIMLDN